MNKNSTLLFLLMILYSFFVASTHGGPHGPETPELPPEDFQQAYQSDNTVLGRVPPTSVTTDFGNELTVEGTVDYDGQYLDADNLDYNFDGVSTDMQEVEDFRETEDGYTIGRVERLTQNGITIIGAEGVEFKNGELTAEKADSFIRDGSVTTNIEKLNSKVDIFSVKKADSFLSDCIRVDDVKDSEFKITDKVEIITKSEVNLKITDCSYNEVEFKGKGKVTIDKSSDNPKYTLENGTLTKKENNYNETVESNNSVIIETDKTFGFKCLTIIPVGSYFYSDKDLRKDFIINVPKESSTYKLCLRKNRLQQFKDYNGIVDFVDKKIELNGIINYLRYPLKNNQISSLLSSFVYKGLKDINALFFYDNNLIFLNNIFLKNKNNIKSSALSITYPSNYYTIKEMEVDNEIHSIIELNLDIKKQQLTQNINYEYKTEYFEPKLSINRNVLTQDTGKNKLIILPPEHENINKILKNGKI